jgi:hypothetical protein
MSDLLAHLGALVAAADPAAAAARLPAGAGLYPRSVLRLGQATLAVARDAREKFLVQAAVSAAGLVPGFTGERLQGSGIVAQRIPKTHENLDVLRRVCPWTTPVSLRQRRTTVGFGDRLGLATAGHLQAIQGYQVAPVLAQQSIRELTLTKRTYPGVVDDATFLVFQEGFCAGYGADGDHLKTIKDIDIALDAGMAMITLDLTEVLHPEAAKFSASEVDAAFARLPADFQQRVLSTYADRTFTIGDEAITFPALEAKRCGVMYVDAVRFTPEVYRHLKARRGDAFDLELSIDETSAPTLPAHHLFIISELVAAGVILNSLAPRFIGDFQKGIDYIGDLGEFERQFATHCKIAQTYGNYKISVHSGSDKFSAFPVVGRLTAHRLHLKTAGTSWLESLRALSQVEPALYRQVHQAAYDGLAQALKLYHITADFTKVPKLETLSDAQLPGLLEQIEARQLLHITYGHILHVPAIRPAFFAALHRHEAAYNQCLVKHFRRHLDTLAVPRG